MNSRTALTCPNPHSRSVPGCKSGILDIAPDHATIGFGISNTLANVPGFVAPSLVGALLTDYSDSSQWQAVFWVSASVHVAGSLLYLGWGSAELQPWAAEARERAGTEEGGDGELTKRETEAK